MRSRLAPIVIASASLAISLAGCARSDVGVPVARIELPAPPVDVAPCLRQAFPAIPDRALSRADIVRLVGRAKLLDREKAACGERALAWIASVRRDFAK